MVADRLDVIQAFEQILFDKDWKKRLLERTQLHRLLVHELWLLGEEYALGVDDDGLRTLLEKHLNLIGRAELAAEADIKQITGEDGVPDLMVYRRRKIDRDRFEHLVIELKRPSLKLGQAEVSQIERYAFTVADDERFDTKKCQWNFVLLGNSLDTFAKRRATSDNLPDGCIHQDNGVRVWIHPWAEVLNSARARYEFFAISSKSRRHTQKESKRSRPDTHICSMEKGLARKETLQYHRRSRASSCLARSSSTQLTAE